MTERPIIFSAPEVRALLANRKSQVRRLAWRSRGGVLHDGTKLRAVPTIWQSIQPGDWLWVCETWAIDAPLDQVRREVEDAVPPAPGHGPYYHADNTHEDSGLMWRTPIYMPRWASRLTLKVTDVRLERLKDITTEGAEAEGIKQNWTCLDPGTGSYAVENDVVDDFRSHWESLHGLGSWHDNPEVVVITFRCYENET